MKKLLFLSPVVLAISLSNILPVRQSVAPTPEIPAEVNTLLTKYGCIACHAMDKKLVGPMWTDVAAKKYSKKRIIELVTKPEPNNWPGYPAMAPQSTVPKADLGAIAGWLTKLK
jgi:cytochrome c